MGSYAKSYPLLRSFFQHFHVLYNTTQIIIHINVGTNRLHLERFQFQGEAAPRNHRAPVAPRLAVASCRPSRPFSRP